MFARIKEWFQNQLQDDYDEELRRHQDLVNGMFEGFELKLEPRVKLEKRSQRRNWERR